MKMEAKKKRGGFLFVSNACNDALQVKGFNGS